MLTRRQIEAAIVGVCLLAAAGFATIYALSHWPREIMHRDASTIPSTAAGQDFGSHKTAVDDLRRRARALLVEMNLPGLSVAVGVDGAPVWTEAFGYANKVRTRLMPDTRFRLGALSKPITSAAVARLYEQGRLDLDAPVQRYVPAYPEKKWTVTTRQLMGDVAGVYRIRGDGGNDAMPTEHCANVDDTVALLKNEPLLFEPGTQYRYSISGWMLISAVVQGAAGKSFGRFMEDEIFEPLKMDRTIVSEAPGEDGKPVWPDYSCVAGAGAFLSTPTDLIRFGSAMLKPGFLKPETIAMFQTPTRLSTGAPTTYALGWTVGNVDLGGQSTRMVSHRGSPMGGAVSLLLFPDLGLVVAAATNETDVSHINAFALQVAEAFAKR